MADKKGMKTKQAWAPLDLSKTKAQIAQNMKDVPYKMVGLFNAVTDAILAYAEDYYSDSSSDDKYVKIVDNIVAKIKNFAEFTTIQKVDDNLKPAIEDFFNQVKRLLEGVDIGINLDQLKNDVLQGILSEVKADLHKNFDELKNTVLEVLNINESSKNQIVNAVIDQTKKTIQEVNKKQEQKKKKKKKNEAKQYEKLIDITKKVDNALLKVQKKITKRMTKAFIEVDEMMDKLQAYVLKKRNEKIKKISLLDIVRAKINDRAMKILPSKKALKIQKALDNVRKKLVDMYSNIDSVCKQKIFSIKDKIDDQLDGIKKNLNKIVGECSRAVIKILTDKFVILGMVIVFLAGLLLRFVQPYIDKYVTPWVDKLTGIEKTFSKDFVKKAEKWGNTATEFLDKYIVPYLSQGLVFLVSKGQFIFDFLKAHAQDIVDVFKKIFIFLFDKIIIPIAKGIGSVAQLIGQALVIIASTLIDIVTIIINAIRPAAPYLMKVLVFIFKWAIKILDIIVVYIKDFAKPFGEFIGGALVIIMMTLNDIFEFIKPGAKPLGIAIAGLIVGLSGILTAVIWVMRMIFKIVNGLRNILILLFYPLKGIAYIAGIAFAFFALVTAKFLSFMLENVAAAAARVKARIVVDLIVKKLKKFLTEVTVDIPNKLKENKKKAKENQVEDSDQLAKFLSSDNDVFQTFDKISMIGVLFQKAMDFLQDDKNFKFSTTIDYLKQNLDNVLNMFTMSFDEMRNEIDNKGLKTIEDVYESVLKKVYEKLDTVLSALSPAIEKIESLKESSDNFCSKFDKFANDQVAKMTIAIDKLSTDAVEVFKLIGGEEYSAKIIQLLFRYISFRSKNTGVVESKVYSTKPELQQFDSDMSHIIDKESLEDQIEFHDFMKELIDGKDSILKKNLAQKVEQNYKFSSSNFDEMVKELKPADVKFTTVQIPDFFNVATMEAE